MDGFLIRKETTAHGTGRQVEGHLKAGDRVVLVEDVMTTGKSFLQAIEAVRNVSGDIEIVALLALRRFVLPEAMHEAGLVGAQVLDFGLASVLAMLTVRTGLMYRLYGQAVARQQPLPLPEVEAA